jgi:hypothetical protein
MNIRDFYLNYSKNKCENKLLKITKYKSKIDGSIVQKVSVMGNIEESYENTGLLDF